MDRQEILDLITEIRNRGSELDDVEVKSAQKGTPKRIYDSLSALSNRVGGGVILFGFDERLSFATVGVYDVAKLQSDLSNLASNEMEPPLRIKFAAAEIEGKSVVAVEVPECPRNQKPCYYKPAGLSAGSYIRVGDGDRRMTEYEIHSYLSSRQQPKDDVEVIHEATLDALNSEQLDGYLRQLKIANPNARYLRGSREQILKRLNIIADEAGNVHPTLAGLLVFGEYPQQFFPSLMITFVHYYGTDETEKTPRGERFLDNKKFEGTIPEMVESAENYVLASMRKGALIAGLYREDILEYPKEALREAIINALAHRDYSHYVRGSQIQIRMFADRLEIRSPGGLYGTVTVDNLEEEQSTRNAALMRIMEDVQLVENRGSGIQAMIDAMRKAQLEPPKFDDKRSSFWVTFKNHTMMTPEAVNWLNQFYDMPLSDGQRLALVYLRNNERMANRDYQRLNNIDSVQANRELRHLVDLSLLEQHSTRGGAYYTLAVSSEVPPTQIEIQEKSDEERILEYVKQHGSINNSECQRLLNVSHDRASYLLRNMKRAGKLRMEGERRWARYYSP